MSKHKRRKDYWKVYHMAHVKEFAFLIDIISELVYVSAAEYHKRPALLHPRLMAKLSGSSHELRLPFLSQACTVIRPSFAKTKVSPGGWPSLSSTGFGMWQMFVPAWMLGATDTENLVASFAHLVMQCV